MFDLNFVNNSYKKILQEVAEAEGLKYVTLELSPGCSKGDNYMGTVYRVKANGLKDQNNVTLNLIMKVFGNEGLRGTAPTEEAYKREHYAYTEVLRELQKLQEETAVKSDFRFPFLKYYYSSDKHTEEMLVLEDLKVQGFIMHSRLKAMDSSHTALVMTSLAKFHALSYALKAKKPIIFEKLASNCPDIFCNGPFGEYLESYCHTAARMFVSSITDPENNVRAKQFAKAIVEKMRVVTRAGNHGVLAHGDCTVNNVLFKYQEGVPVEARLLDFQMLRYGSPAVDILYFIFCCTDQSFRRRHYFSMLDLYHDTLTACLREQGLKINGIMSKESFRQEIKEFADFGLGMSILALKIFVSDDDDIPDLTNIIGDRDNIKLTLPSGGGYKRYVERINGVLSDYVNFGYIE